MKILCTADWHIGKKIEGFSRLEEQKIVLDEIASISERENSDVVIVAGDCFDNQSPTPEMTKLFVSALARLARGGECLVLVIAGNHDNPLFLSSSEAFASQLGVLILGYPFDVPYLEDGAWKVTHKDKGMIEVYFKKSKKSIRFLLAPYSNAQRLKKDLGVSDTDKKAWELLCGEWQKNISSEVPNILVSHSFLLPEKKGIFDDDAPVEDSEERSIVGTLGAISLETLPDGIDYLIAGHIHKPQSLYSKRTKAFYTGSPLIYSLSESGQQKSVLMLDLGRKFKEYLIPLEQARDIKQIRFDNFDNIKEILDREKDNYLVLIWEGDNYFTAEEHRFLRENHNYILRIESQPKNVKKYTAPEEIKEQSTEELFAEFFRSKNKNQDPPEDLLGIFRECAAEELSHNTVLKKRGFLPKSLSIKGFYSYKDEVFIDFERLEKRGFFGVFGNTGSGKSAIVEAMITALYYQVRRLGSFGKRGKGSFSNAYGIMNLESDELLIEFIFEIKDGAEEYKCRVHAKRNKKNPLDVKPNREVFLMEQGEWVPCGGLSGEEIMGLGYDDFCKTIILQQQDFMGFISEDPKENTETLMRLFQLERFELGGVVDSMHKKTLAEYDSLADKMSNLEDADESKLANLQDLREELVKSSSDVKISLDQKYSELGVLLDKEQKRIKSEELKNRFEELKAKEDDFKRARERALVQPVLDKERDMERRKSDIQKYTEKTVNLSAELEIADKEIEDTVALGKSKKSELEQLNQELAKKEESREKLLDMRLGDELSSLKNKLDAYARLQNEADNLQNKINAFDVSIEQKSRIAEELKSKEKEESDLRDLEGLASAEKPQDTFGAQDRAFHHSWFEKHNC